jgi:hypothetical protein
LEITPVNVLWHWALACFIFIVEASLAPLSAKGNTENDIEIAL